MSYDYREDVIGSLVRCNICGQAKTRGEGCQACIKRADAAIEAMKTYEEKDAELARLRAELASAQEELSLVKCGEPNHPDRAYAMKNWLKTFGFKVFCELEHGEVGFVLSLLQEGEISRGKAAEAIAELIVGNEPPLPQLNGNTFAEDEFAAKTVKNLRADLAATQGRYGALVNRLTLLVTGCSVGEYDSDEEMVERIETAIKELQAELAAEREQHEKTMQRLDAEVGKYLAERERSAALAAALEMARVQAHHTATTFTVWRRNGYFDAEAAEVWVHNDKEAIVRVANDPSAILAARDARFTESWRKEVDAMRDERDSMAAALALAEQHMTGPHGAGCVCKCPVIDGHASGCKIIGALVSGGGLAALAADRADQRRKGAAWALRMIATKYRDDYLPAERLDIGPLCDDIEATADAIERGEAEVPND